MVAKPWGQQLTLRFVVQYDTGIGMNDEQLGRLFGPRLHQADSSMTRRFRHWLGLAICKRLVGGVDGGSIRVSSQPGEGSQILVHPAAADPNP